MNQIADLAEKFGNGELRLTPTQNIIIPNVKEDSKKIVLETLAKIGFSMNLSKTRWLSVGCSSDFCGKATGMHAKETLRDIVEYLEEYFGVETLNEMGLRINVSGCPNDCGASLVSDIGLIGKQMKVNNCLMQVYDIYVGGSIGEKPSLGTCIEKNVPAEELKFRVASLITSYIRNRKTGEDIGNFYKRYSNEKLKNSLGIRR
jgi:sulfite reductase (ferredoxin)